MEGIELCLLLKLCYFYMPLFQPSPAPLNFILRNPPLCAATFPKGLCMLFLLCESGIILPLLGKWLNSWPSSPPSLILISVPFHALS